MKKLLLVTFIISINIFSQALEDDYINSLPPEVAEQLRLRAQEKDEDTKPIYRQSTKIDIEREIKRYGDKFFSSVQSTFMPLNEPNLDDSYILDFGDVIDIQYIGQKSKTFSLEIKRDGSINLPDIGKVNLSGLSLKRADELIQQKVKTAFIGTEAFITLSNIRDIQILIAGDAYQPGVYTVNGNTTILQALVISGGISDFGSYREIHLKRDGKIFETLDLYKILIDGDLSKNTRLKTGDVVFVTTVKKLIRSQGGFKRPGLYELNDNETFIDLFNFSGGAHKFANKNKVTVLSITDGDFFERNITLDELDVKPVDGDTLTIDKYKVNQVTIRGEVKFPGEYYINEDSTLSSIIIRAGGYTKNADYYGARYFNQRAKAFEEEAKVQILNDLYSYASFSNEKSGDLLSFYSDQIRQYEPMGRLVTEFNLEKITSNSEIDIILQDGDIIEIPKKSNNVFLFGEVKFQGAQKFIQNNDIYDYINAAGGITSSGIEEQIYIVFPNGEVSEISNGRWGFNSVKNVPAGSVIYIPRDVGIAKGLNRWALITPIIGNIAISLASLAAIDNN